MKKTKQLLSGFFILLSGCGSEYSSRGENSLSTLLQQMEITCADLKQELSQNRIEIEILNDKIKKLDRTNTITRKEPSSSEQKIAELEKKQDKILAELQELHAHANQTTTAFSQYREKIQDLEDRLKEVVKLKGTLTSITQAMNGSATVKTHRVRSGDSLEKIARMHHTTIEEIKSLNHLSQDTIFIGQELKIPQ